jgi:hypothetical protein
MSASIHRAERRGRPSCHRGRPGLATLCGLTDVGAPRRCGRTNHGLRTCPQIHRDRMKKCALAFSEWPPAMISLPRKMTSRTVGHSPPPTAATGMSAVLSSSRRPWRSLSISSRWLNDYFMEQWVHCEASCGEAGSTWNETAHPGGSRLGNVGRLRMPGSGGWAPLMVGPRVTGGERREDEYDGVACYGRAR